MPHVHISLIGFLTTAAYILIFGFMWRFGTAHLHDTTIGHAMAWLY